MIRMWNDWVQFWTSKEMASSIAGVRIGIGITLLYTFGVTLPDEVWRAIWVDANLGGIRYYNNTPWVIEMLGGPTPRTIQTVLGLGLMAGAMLILGIFSRTSALIGMLMMNTIAWHNPMASGGHDDLIANALWILCFVRSDTSYSLYSRI